MTSTEFSVVVNLTQMYMIVWTLKQSVNKTISQLIYVNYGYHQDCCNCTVKFYIGQDNKYILFDGLTYNTRGYFASSVVFFRTPKRRG